MAEQHHPLRRTQSHEAMGSPIQGMESVIATVSGYHGSDRFNLIKLISHAGASYVGALSRSTTHLVCWKFEGKKYELADKFNTIVLNHRWIEDCIKQGKRVPERPYILQCGQEVGPLLLEPPPVAKVGVSTKNWNVLSDKSSVCDDSEQIIDLGCGTSRRSFLTDSCLLNEDLFPEFKENNSSLKSKQKHVRRNSKQELRSCSRPCFQDPPLTRSLRMELQESSTHLARAKRNISNGNGSSMAETSRKGRRLAKRNIGRDMKESALSDSDQEFHPIRFQNMPNDVVTVLSDDSGEERNGNILGTEGKTDNGLHIQRRIRNRGLKGVVEVDENHLSPSKDPNIYVKDAPTSLEGTPQDGCFEVENSKEEFKNRFGTEDATRIPPSMELSCVICWTEFSSTRGILPCGHRFCYSCIESWAGHMGSKSKNSTCPLCKASFTSITKVDDADMIDQKIYSQTIPSAPKMDIPVPTYRGIPNFSAQSPSGTVCVACSGREPEELLVACNLCHSRCIHSYCLDPPLFPWTCIHCKDLRLVYLLNH